MNKKEDRLADILEEMTREDILEKNVTAEVRRRYVSKEGVTRIEINEGHKKSIIFVILQDV